jgi:hypothetical protein
LVQTSLPAFQRLHGSREAGTVPSTPIDASSLAKHDS